MGSKNTTMNKQMSKKQKQTHKHKEQTFLAREERAGGMSKLGEGEWETQFSS